MTELTPAEVLAIEQEAKPDRHYDSGAEGYEAGYLAASLPRELLLKQERERVEGYEKALKEIEKIVLAYHKENGNSPAANHCRNIAIESLAKYKAK